jgi:hypothetical protein
MAKSHQMVLEQGGNPSVPSNALCECYSTTTAAAYSGYESGLGVPCSHWA